MTVHGEATALTEIKAVAPGYPLKGRISVREQAGAPAARPERIPEPGTVWVDDRLLGRLELAIGDSIGVGERSLRIAAQVIEDPETSVGFLNLGPRLIMNAADLPSTGLITVGSRVRYRLAVAGEPAAVAGVPRLRRARDRPGPARRGRARCAPRDPLGAGAGGEVSRPVRPAVRASGRGGRGAGRAPLSAAASGRLAVMRCLGASQSLIVRLHVQQFVAARLGGEPRRLPAGRGRPGGAGGAAAAAGGRRAAAARARCRCCRASPRASCCCSASPFRRSSRCAACRPCACCAVISGCRTAPAGPGTRSASRRWPG